MWASHTDFDCAVSSNWSLDVNGTKQFQLCRKLKSLKGPLTLLFSHISVRADNAKSALIDAQLQLHDQPSNVCLQQEEIRIRKQATFLSDSERNFYLNKPKANIL
ncbi:Uncharacterized protein Adt_31279 [Abeliophyllum distichum]|uniref:Uncharacterized protein n=1 Tax=Abeliophyllum distichum TaxID=126358 RepID=A0ABD1RDT1_9LAMI